MFFFFNDTATTEIYTFSLHDALPICRYPAALVSGMAPERVRRFFAEENGAYAVAKRVRDLCVFTAHSVIRDPPDRKSTRLNSSHANIPYAVFCLKKKTIICLNQPNMR